MLSEIGQLRQAIWAGRVSPYELADFALKNANGNAGQNVYIALDAEKVREEARNLSAQFAGATEFPPLYGLPVSLKDCFDLTGFVTTLGTKFYAQKNAPASEDSAVAARLKSQGAVIVGKTNVHPLMYGITGENQDYGDCLQPKRPECLTGGSTSGGAASVQENSAVAAIGTDTGGSIRVPAGLCGLAGYRASIELAHQRGLWKGSVALAPSFDTLGWIYGDLRDGPMLAQALFGLETSAQAEVKTKVSIGTPAEKFLRDCDATVAKAFQIWKSRLEERGAKFVEFDSEFWEGGMDIYAPIQGHEASEIHAKGTGGDFSVFKISIGERLAWGAAIPQEEVERARERHSEFAARMQTLLETHDYLMAPCAPIHCLKPGADHRETRRIILRYTAPMSLAGTPVVTLPSASGAGMQLVAAKSADARLLAYSALFGGAT